MRLCFDLKQMKPGCPLLAAAMGADTQLSKEFDANDWLTFPTPDLKVYEITPEQFDQLCQHFERMHQDQ